MNAMKNKIKSQRGASITFALLLFLVCAIISSIVIVAATAAAGRMSGQVDMDGRYYAVTSVASKLKTEIEGKEVTLSYNEDNPSEATVTGDVSVLLSAVSKDLMKAASTNTDVTDSSPFITIPTKTTSADSSGGSGETDASAGENGGEAASNNSDNSGSSSDTSEKDDESGSTQSNNDITCTVKKKVTNGGLLVFDISASGGNMSKGSYELEVTFSSKLKYHSTDVNNKNKTATVSWKLINMRKMRADYAAS